MIDLFARASNVNNAHKQGYGERISSPCRHQSYALSDVLTRELMGNYQNNLITRPIDWFLSFTNLSGRCKNGNHAPADRHFCTSISFFWIFTPPHVIRGESPKTTKSIIVLLSPLKPIFNAVSDLFSSLFNALTLHELCINTAHTKSLTMSRSAI